MRPPRLNPARLTPQPKMITAKNAKSAESEWLLFVFIAFFAAKIRAGKENYQYPSVVSLFWFSRNTGFRSKVFPLFIA